MQSSEEQCFIDRQQQSGVHKSADTYFIQMCLQLKHFEAQLLKRVRQKVSILKFFKHHKHENKCKQFANPHVEYTIN